MSKEVLTKDEDLEPEPPKTEGVNCLAIPQLNEDIFGRILKFIVERQQRKIKNIVLSEECGYMREDVVGIRSVKLGC